MPGIKLSTKRKLQLLKTTKNQCIYCNCALTLETLTIEHIFDNKLTKFVYNHDKKPYSKNIAPSCHKCNVGRKIFPLQYGIRKGSVYLTKIKRLMLKPPYPIDLEEFNKKIKFLF